MVQEDICLLQQLWSDVNDKRTYKVVVVSKDDIEANFTKYFPRVRNFFIFFLRSEKIRQQLEHHSKDVSIFRSL